MLIENATNHDVSLFYAQLQVHQELSAVLFPNETRRGTVSCYELTLINLAVVPFNFVCHQAEALITDVRNALDQ